MKPGEDATVRLSAAMNRVVFYVLTVALLVPLWAFKYFPSQDGPLHQYNAVVLRDYDRPDRPAFREYFVPNPALVPNWLCPHILPVLAQWFSAAVAEKLVLSAYLILLPIGARYALSAIRPRGGLLALAILPMVPNQFYHFGFHDFCVGMAGYFFVAGYFLKHRRRFAAKNAIVLAIMLLVLYLTHLVAVVMVLPLIGLTTLALYWTGRDAVAVKLRRTLPVAAALAPVVLWAAYFALRPHPGSDLPPYPGGWHHRFFLIPLWLKSYQYYEAIAGVAMFILFFAASFWLVRRVPDRALLLGLPGALLATVVFYILIFLVAPGSFAGAQVLLIRVVAFVFFASLLWWASLPISSRAFARLEWAVAVVSIPVALGLLVSHVLSYRELNSYLNAFEAVAPIIPTGSTVCPIHYNDPVSHSPPTNGESGQHPLSTGIDPFRHAGSIGLAQKGIIDLGNTWATTDHQSLRWQPGLDPMSVRLDRLDDFVGYARRTGKPVDYVLIWTGGIIHDDAQARFIDRQLASSYRLIYTSPTPEYLKLYRRIE
jgi:hypothetical protein